MDNIIQLNKQQELTLEQVITILDIKPLTIEQRFDIENCYNINKDFYIKIDLIYDTTLKTSNGNQHIWTNLKGQEQKFKVFQIIYNRDIVFYEILVIDKYNCTKNKHHYYDIRFVSSQKVIKEYDVTRLNKLVDEKLLIKDMFRPFSDDEKRKLRLRLPKDYLEYKKEFKESKKWKVEEYSPIYCVGGEFGTNRCRKTVLETLNYIGMTVQEKQTNRFYPHIHNTTAKLDENFMAHIDDFMEHITNFKNEITWKTGDILVFGNGKWFNLINVRSKDSKIVKEFETLMINFIAILTGKNNINDKQKGKDIKEQKNRILESFNNIFLIDVEFELILDHWTNYLGIRPQTLNNCSNYCNKKMKSFFNKWDIKCSKHLNSLIDTICRETKIITVDEIINYFENQKRIEEHIDSYEYWD